MKRQRPTLPELHYVPPDMVEEILSRLPAKTLMKLKNVSPSWNNLISETRFCNSHLQKSVDHNRINIMYLHDCYTTLAYEARTGRLVDAYEPDGNGVTFLAQCNGLFCRGIADDIFLWNPSTKQERKVPNSKIEFPPDSCEASIFFGLGYQSSSDDYKLVRITMFHTIDFQTEVKIYSRNTDTWTRIQDFPYEFPFAQPGVFADSCLHWIVSMWDDDVQIRRHYVAAFDLSDNSYGLITLPEFGSSNIGLLDEKLVVFDTCNSDIWVLTQRDGAQPWMRIKIMMDCFEAFDYFQPLCLLKPGQILVRVGAKKVVSFDVAKKRSSDVYTPRMLDCKMVSFVDSLVSPYAPQTS